MTYERKETLDSDSVTPMSWTSMCRGRSINFSIKSEPSPNADLASEVARSNSSFMSYTQRSHSLTDFQALSTPTVRNWFRLRLACRMPGVIIHYCLEIIVVFMRLALSRTKELRCFMFTIHTATPLRRPHELERKGWTESTKQRFGIAVEEVRTCSRRMTRMPRPPPPNAALRMTGRPCVRANACTSSSVLTGPSEPGTTGTRASSAACRARTLSPIASTTRGDGPTKRRPASTTAYANSVWTRGFGLVVFLDTMRRVDSNCTPFTRRASIRWFVYVVRVIG